MNSHLEKYLLLTVKILLFLIIIVALYFSVHYLIPTLLVVSRLMFLALLPFILAMILVILIDPLIDWLVIKKNIKRGLAVAFILAVLLIFLSILILFMVSRLVIELTTLYRAMPFYTKELMSAGLQAVESLRTFITNNPLPIEAQNAFRNNIEAILSELTNIIAFTSDLLFNILTGLPSFVTIIVVSGLATYFISRDKDLIARFMYGLIPKRYNKKMNSITNELSKALVGFFRAQTILITITALQTIIGLTILGVDYALTLGILVGIMDLLPVLGPGTVMIPWAFIHIVTGNVSFGVALLVLYGILIGVRQLIEPKILSESIGLHPLATLMSLYLGLKLLGVWGLIIGPFLFILVKAIMKSLSIH